MDERIIEKSDKKIVYQIGDKVVKSYCENYSTSLILNEALNQSRVSDAGIKTPKVYEVKIYNDKLGIVMDYIEGNPLSQLIAKDSANVDKYIDIFAKTQSAIFSSRSEFLNNSYVRIKNKIFASALPMNIKYGLFYKLREMDFTRDVIHGDYDLSNVIISNDGTPYIIDWGHVSFGNKIFDMAITYALFEIRGEQSLANKYLDTICKLNNIEKEAVLKILVLAYIYIIDRYDKNKQKSMYEKIYELIKLEEV